MYSPSPKKSKAPRTSEVAAEERGLNVLEVEPIALIVDALWTTRRYAEENPQIVGRVLRAYVKGIATVFNDKQKTLDVLRKYMRTVDARSVQNAYKVYVKDLDKFPVPSDKAIQDTLELTYRISPRLASADIRRHLYFGPLQSLKDEGFIDHLYK